MITFTSQQAAMQAANQRSLDGQQQHRTIKKKDVKSWLVVNIVTSKVYDVNGEIPPGTINMEQWSVP